MMVTHRTNPISTQEIVIANPPKTIADDSHSGFLTLDHLPKDAGWYIRPSFYGTGVR